MGLLARSKLGNIADLNDDAILKILCLCDTTDLLHIEQTCRYLKDLAARREVWYAVLLRLPRGCTPSILPYHTRGETDYRELAIKAIRSHRHWTAEEPRPTWRSNLTLKHSDRNVSDMQLLPGGRYFIYFYYNTLYCFDVSRNAYVLERSGGHGEYLNSAYEVSTDGESVNMVIVIRSGTDSMDIQLSVVRFSLNNGQCNSISTMTMDWYNLCSAVGGEYVMLHKPSINGHYILIPYQLGFFDGNSPQRGAILFDYKQSLSLLLSLERNIDPSIKRQNLPMGITKSHLLYMSNHGSRALAIHTVSFNLFKGYWRDSSNLSEWVTYNVPLEDGDAHYTFEFSSTTLPEYVLMSIALSNWLDRKKEQLADHVIESLSFVDLCFIHKASGDDPLSFLSGQRRLEYHLLRFVELTSGYETDSSPGNYAHQSGVFTHKETSVFEEHDGQVIAVHMPSRHGRLVTCSEKDHGPLRSKAISLYEDGKPHAGSLEHLDDRFVRGLIMDYYTSTVLYSSCPQDSVTLHSIKDATEYVVESYD